VLKRTGRFRDMVGNREMDGNRNMVSINVERWVGLKRKGEMRDWWV
jgi:hypothetical protein